MQLQHLLFLQQKPVVECWLWRAFVSQNPPLPDRCLSFVPLTSIHSSQTRSSSKLTRSVSNVITPFVITRFEFHNKPSRGEKPGKISHFYPNQCLSAALWRERAFTRIWWPLLAAKWLIITSLMWLKKRAATGDGGNLCSHPERKS